MKLVFPEPLDPMRMLRRRRSSFSVRIDLKPSISICFKDILGVAWSYGPFFSANRGAFLQSDIITSLFDKCHSSEIQAPSTNLYIDKAIFEVRSI
jgi:hypothetical protein